MEGHSLGFDPAARHSAAALLAPDGELVKYWTLDAKAWDKDNPQTNLREMRVWAEDIRDALYDTEVQFITVENVSHYMANPAPALRMQGVLLDRLDFHPLPDPLLIIPTVWQNALGWKKTTGSSATSKSWAKWLCANLGYDITPTPGSKAAEDATDAVLIARWRQLREAGQVD